MFLSIHQFNNKFILQEIQTKNTFCKHFNIQFFTLNQNHDNSAITQGQKSIIVNLSGQRTITKHRVLFDKNVRIF